MAGEAMRSGARIPTTLVASISAVALAADAALAWAPQSRATTDQAVDTQLTELITADWNFQKEHSPALAQFSGDREHMNAWPNLSRSGISVLARNDRERLASLRTIPKDRLSANARLDYELFERDLLNRQEEFSEYAYLTPFWQFDRFGPSALRLLAYVASVPPPVSNTELHARVVWLRSFPAYVTQQVEFLRRSKNWRMLPSRDLVQMAITQLEAELATTPEQSVFYRSIATAAPTLTAARDRPADLESARTAITEKVKPALKQLHDFLLQQYLPRCPSSPSLARWRNGPRLYDFLIRLETTTNQSAQQFHNQGLTEVARIRREIEGTVRATGFTGTVQDFTAKVRSDPAFQCRTEEELLNAYRSTLDRIRPGLYRLFNFIPEEELTLIPRRFGPSGPAASYAPAAPDASRKATVRINVSNPEMRPKFEMIAVMLHETLPGHHLQRTIEQERSLGNSRAALQRLRRSDAFVEGWGLYAESLGEEMGLYSDPYERFGRLSYELIRAVRLVIDTGIHAKGWSREEAVRYFIEQTGESKAIGEGEALRAMWDPGSLVAYKAGELTFKSMRARASAELGSAFDIRDFHDFVLREGSLPLDVLEREFTVWLNSRAKDPRTKRE